MSGRQQPTLTIDDDLFVVPSLRGRETFVRAFRPSGDTRRDIEVFMVGTGCGHLLDAHVAMRGDPVDLLRDIRRNHRAELHRLEAGDGPGWSEVPAEDWSDDQLRYYCELLRLELQALNAILDGNSPGDGAA